MRELLMDLLFTFDEKAKCYMLYCYVGVSTMPPPCFLRKVANNFGVYRKS